MPKNIEIEIQVRIENVKPLLDLLEKEGDFQYEKQQIDEYYTPPDRDFISVRPIREWLRLRNMKDKSMINYKNWHYDDEGKSNHCDEYETPVEDIEQVRNIFKALNYKQIVTVDKYRKTWMYKNWEVAVDNVKDLGDFIEIEYKGVDAPDSKQETKKMGEFLRDIGCGKVERNYLGYPFQLLFPDEIKWEKV